MSKETMTDDLAQEIRRIDGRHDMGACALAEALMPFIAALSSTAAPAPVAGDADIEFWAERLEMLGDLHNCGGGTMKTCARMLREQAALAQDRASQAGAAVPELHQWQIDSLRYGMRLSPETHADDQIALALSAAMLAAAPTPDAEGEVK